MKKKCKIIVYDDEGGDLAHRVGILWSIHRVLLDSQA